MSPFVATKGGTGKSSLAFAIGIEATKHGSVYLADLDPQASLTEVCRRRKAQADMFENPMLLEDLVSLPHAIETLRETGFERDFLVVDTPGSMIPVIRSVIQAADCIILPVQESLLDVLAQEDAAQLILEAGKEDIALFVMNRIDPNTKTADLEKRLRAVLPNQPVKIIQRVVYARSILAGKSAAEQNKDAAADIAQLWNAIDEILKKDRKHENVLHNGSEEALRA
jgi:chromosome partitioning protein